MDLETEHQETLHVNRYQLGRVCLLTWRFVLLRSWKRKCFVTGARGAEIVSRLGGGAQKSYGSSSDGLEVQLAMLVTGKECECGLSLQRRCICCPPDCVTREGYCSESSWSIRCGLRERRNDEKVVRGRETLVEAIGCSFGGWNFA